MLFQLLKGLNLVSELLLGLNLSVLATTLLFLMTITTLLSIPQKIMLFIVDMNL